MVQQLPLYLLRLKLENSDFVNDTSTVNNDERNAAGGYAQSSNNTDYVEGESEDDVGVTLSSENHGITSQVDANHNNTSQIDVTNLGENMQLNSANELREPDLVPATPSSSKRSCLPKVKSTVLAKPVGESEWKQLKIISCGGKATGKYAKYMNVLDTESNKTDCVNWDTISEWKQIDEEILMSNTVKKMF